MFTFKLRRGTAAAWLAADPILQSGEPGVEIDTGKLKIGNGIAKWTELGYLSGEGAPGEDGADGLSAYQIAVLNGFIGTEVAWLASLEGTPGTNGTNGADGSDGAPGADGSDGASAYEVAVAQGFVGNEAAWLLSLKGADGSDGADGPPGADGADYTGPTITVSASAPSSPTTGDIWIDTSA